MGAVTAAVIAGAAVAAAGAGYAMSQGGPDLPEGRNVAAETRDTLQAQIDLAPQRYAMEAEYQPRYNALNIAEQEALLFGREASTRTEEYTDYEPYEVTYRGPTGRYELRTERRPVTKTRTINTPSQTGILDILDRAQPRALALQRRDRENEIKDVAELGPAAQEAYRKSNPGAAGLVDILVGQARANLEGGLSPGEKRDIQQNIRAAQAARGVGYGPSDTFEEVYGSTVTGQEIARGRAREAIGASQAFYGDPFQIIMGRPSGSLPVTAGAMGGAGQLAATAGPRLFNPESPFAADVYNTNFNARSAAAISASNNQAALAGSLIGLGGSVAGAGIRASGPSYGGMAAPRRTGSGYDPYGVYV